MEEYYLVICSNGKNSPSLKSIGDAGTWLEDNWDKDCRHCTIKKYKVDRKKMIKDVTTEVQKLEERLNKAKEKLAKIGTSLA